MNQLTSADLVRACTEELNLPPGETTVVADGAPIEDSNTPFATAHTELATPVASPGGHTCP
ncbi:hypothetical protein [Janibacter sp. GS2]|uniref:hypothetical protein n=1 Tax=Janibacter sp. GS2 TaxID=3442646 RepID=UPI003EB74C30